MPWCILAFAVVTTVAATRTAVNLHVSGHAHIPRYGMQDFRDAVYYPAVALLDGRNPYDPDGDRDAVDASFALYAPVILLLHAPLALLPPRPAAAAYFAVTLALIVVFAALVLCVANVRPTAVPVLAVAALIAVSRPGHSTLYLGQVTLYAVIGTVLALFWSTRRPHVAAVGVFLAWLKPTFGIPLALLMLCRGDRRVVLWGSAAAGAASAAIVALLVGAAGGLMPFVETLLVNPHALLEQRIHRGPGGLRIDAAALLQRLGAPAGLLTEILAGVGILLPTAAVITRLRTPSQAAYPISGAPICLAALTSVYHQPDDALLCAVPVAALAASGWQRSSTWESRLPTAILAASVVPTLNYRSTTTVLSRLPISDGARLTLSSINGVALLAARLLTVALGLGVARLGARPRHVEAPA